MHYAERIAEFLLSIGAVQLNVDEPFTWNTGIRSPVYCDIRMLLSHPEARKFIVDAYVNRIRNLPNFPQSIAGTATAGIGWGALVAERLDVPFCYVRTQAKGHGMRQRVEGDVQKGQRIVVIEDLISTGKSSLSTVEALREEFDVIVTDVISIFSYELLSSREMAEESLVMFHSLATLSALLRVALRDGRILERDVKEIEEFVEDPRSWKAKVGV